VCAINAQISDHSFTFGSAAYRYNVFTPKGPTEQLPALLLIHGAGGRGMDMLNQWKTFAEKKRIVLVAPDFPLDAEFEKTIPELFPALMEKVREAQHFDPHRVYIFGYSAGGYCTFDAATLASTYFAAAGTFGSFIDPSYDSIVTQATRKTPIAIYIGDHDQWVSLEKTRRTRDLLKANHFPVHYTELIDRDHNYSAASSTINPDVWKFMSQYSLP
jgi:poly(3-hydroxybutyrate) depolymerase